MRLKRKERGSIKREGRIERSIECKRTAKREPGDSPGGTRERMRKGKGEGVLETPRHRYGNLAHRALPS